MIQNKRQATYVAKLKAQGIRKFSFWLSEEQRSKLEQIAAKRGLSRQQALEALIEAAEV